MKKILFLLIFLFMMSAVNVYATQYYGDVDNNGRINSVDYILIRKHILKIVTLDEDSLIRANINKDNKVNAADYILLRKMILNDETKVPIEEKVTPSITISPISKTYTGNVVEAGINSSIGTPVATYYSDSSCKTKTTTSNAVSIGGAPKEAGTYYVIVKVTKGTNYNEATSACTKAVVINRQYTVTYNPNGGSGSNTTQTVNYNTDWTTKSNIFTRNGYELAGWSTKTSGSVTHNLNKAQGKWTSTSNLTLYAVWKVKQYIVTYNPNGGSGSNTTQTVDYNTDWTTKTNIFTRDGYELAGWSTKSSGGVTHNLNKAQGKWTSTSNLTLYAVWNKESKLVLPEDFNVTSKYALYQEYSSPTLKYKTLKANGGYKYYGLVWVKDAYHQLNSANSNLTSQNRMTHLNNEIGSMNYGSKGMIATNGSFTINDRSNSPVIATKGIYTLNDRYITKLPDGRPTNYTILTMGSNGNLTIFDTTSVTEQTNWLNSVGGRNTWTIVYYRTGDWNYNSWQGNDFRTGICQIDKHNFVLFVGYSSGISTYMKELHDEFGCVRVANLDGGGSPGMYYKYSTDSRIKKLYEVNKDNRRIADMLYFVEQ